MNNIEIKSTTKHLNRWQINKSKDGLYETSEKVAELIFETTKDLLPIDSFICDPQAGSGRLLSKFKHKQGNKYNVLGIEYNENKHKELVRKIGKKGARCGNCLDYFSNDIVERNVTLFVANPPYGLNWEYDQDRSFFTLGNGATIKSEYATLEIINEYLLDYPSSMAVVILPKSAMNNGRFMNYIHKKFNLLLNVKLINGFQDEHKIDVETHILYLYRFGHYDYNYTYAFRKYSQKINLPTREYTIDAQDKDTKFKDIISDIKELLPFYNSNNSIDMTLGTSTREIDLNTIPDLSQVGEYKVDYSSINYDFKKGLQGNKEIISLLKFYGDVGLEHYNSVLGRNSSLEECYFSNPALIRNGFAKTLDFVKNAEIGLSYNDKDIKKFKKLRGKWKVDSTPLYSPKSQELLAYYLNKDYDALRDYVSDGKILIKAGESCLVKPTWKRDVHNIETKEVHEETQTIHQKRDVENGYLQLIVKTKEGSLEFNENKPEEIKEFIETFGLPDVKSIAELYPERVKHWANNIAIHAPDLFEFQAEDLARLLVKRNVFIGYEMGGGKTKCSLEYATLRQYNRALIICQGSLVENWMNEAKKFGFKMTIIRSHNDINELKKRIKAKDFDKLKTEFFVIGQEFLSLDGGKIYNEWTCVKHDKKGQVVHSETCIKAKCSKGHSYEIMNKICPKCGATYDEGWTGKYCNSCNYTAYTYGTNKKGDKGYNQYPAYKRIKKLFSCVITDESQNFANRSLRGEASRAINSKSKVMLTGTIMKNYITDVFLNFGWLLGYGNPVFYYNRKDIKKFIEEFGSYEMITEEYIGEMKNASRRNRKQGKKKLLPEVSNLNRFWRMISPFTVRRKSLDIKELKDIKRTREIIYLPMCEEHRHQYDSYYNWAKEIIDYETSKDSSEINMGVISKCLWTLRFSATFPRYTKLSETSELLGNSMPNIKFSSLEWNKLTKLLEIVKDRIEKKEKILIFSGLREMQVYMYEYLLAKGIKTKYVGSSVKTSKRFDEITDFEKNYDVLVTGSNVLNRGYSILGANNVIFTDLQYTPEVTDQAEFRVIRPGQQKDVNIYYLLSEETIDEDMERINYLKRQAINQAIDKEARFKSTEEIIKQADSRNPEAMIALKIKSSKMKDNLFPNKKERQATIISVKEIKKTEECVQLTLF